MAAGRRGIGRWLRLGYAACLAGATCNHVAMVLRHGLAWDYGGVPAASAAFWTALTLLDPLAIILLLTRPVAGVAATAAIIIADVAHNLWLLGPASLGSNHAVQSQAAFLLFVLATLRRAAATGKYAG